MFIGLVLCAGAFFGSVARELVRLDAADLVVSLRAFGRECRVRRLPRREIEEIAIKPSSASPGESHSSSIFEVRNELPLAVEQRDLLAGVVVRGEEEYDALSRDGVR